MIYKSKKNYAIKWNLITNFCDRAKLIKTNFCHYNSKNYTLNAETLLSEKEHNDFTKN